ncbi:cell cycle checkpoint protein RAD17-like isoform X2 [Papaver somniferum]|uniref:cell cycle checkpoint protein RAD17-like isoform X2 n=1 Tax=Papaver somniferum TaxID=3469 RepID=UPI000E702ADA|nr:cell cycle checkpoint protein RAD17-like isoform X2 [Papaver somniferum]
MGKRNIVLLSSSSDNEDDHLSSRVCTKPTTRSKSKKQISVSAHGTRKTSCSGGGSKTKRSRRSLSSTTKELFLSHTSSIGEFNFDAFTDGFYEDFQGLAEVPNGSQKSNKKELWVDKYKPQSLQELAIHKKKVEEVKMWLEERLRTSKDEFHSHALVITGQAGVGKSATVRAIASHLGVNLCEWETPTPTLWQEHIHNSNLGVSYMSKLDEFETFVERIRKYSMIPPSSSGGTENPYVLLIDDLPLANGKAAHGKLYLQSCLESAGACKVAFNPVTTNSIKVALSRICKEEQCSATADQIALIAKASGGDIRHAVTSLQYFCLRQRQIPSLLKLSSTHSKEKLLDIAPMGGALSFGRDETLSLFHALGKFLHNKRESLCASGLGADEFQLRERFVRLPLQMGDPENVLSKAHGQARPIADFLHENVLDFISDEAIEDASAVTSYLSDVDCLLATSHGSTWSHTMTGQHELEKIGQLAAASVSVRGVLLGNSHPAPSRWHSIRSPKIWQVEQSSRRNKDEMLRQRIEASESASASDVSIIATEYRPILKWLGYRTSEVHRRSNVVMEENSDGDIILDDINGENSSDIDEIEDW